MSISRLERSTNALLTDMPSLTRFCDARGIPYTTDFYKTVLPNVALQTQFANGYFVHSLPMTGLTETGASTAIIFEQKSFKNKATGKPVYAPSAAERSKLQESFHGEVVATVCQQVGSALQPGVNAIYIQCDLNPSYREAFEKPMVETIKDLIENQGIPVIISSIGWDDLHLDFDKGLDEQSNHFWRVTAFVVDSAGNDGHYGEYGNLIVPRQKHNVISHAAPLVVHIGAAAQDANGNWAIEGYSAANSPTFLAPVAPSAGVLWKEDTADSVIGTSVAGPYAGAVLTALNRRYGSYLTREQILFATIATCKPITRVSPYGKKTPAARNIAYTTNAAGLDYNPECGGFGLVDPAHADRLLAHMVAQTQKMPSTITVPTEQRVKIDLKKEAPVTKTPDGRFLYEITMPPGLALKTTIEVEFDNEFGMIALTSPSGTCFPMILSKSPKENLSFGISTSHGWTGEPLAGKWVVSSTTPVKRLRLNQHHFPVNDIVHTLDIKALSTQAWPELTNAIPLRNLGPDYSVSRVLHSRDVQTLGINGRTPTLDSLENILAELKALPSGFTERRREAGVYNYVIDGTSPAGTLEAQANMASNNGSYGNDAEFVKAARLYQQASILYAQSNKKDKQVNVLSLGAQCYLNCRYIKDERGNLNPEQAIPLLQQAIGVSAESGHWYAAYRDNDFLYTALCRTCAYYENDQPEKAAIYASLLKNVREQARYFSFNRQGGLAPEAHRVEEGESGYSNLERIGTDNVSQCITIIAQNPVTLKTGLTHLDYQVDVSTLDNFFSSLGEHRLRIRLVGARFQGEAHTHNNLISVMQYLANINADIISADIYGNDKGPSAVVVDPQAFTLEEKVPALSTQNERISNGVLIFTPDGKQIVKQFDFTESSTRLPILLDTPIFEELRKDYIGCSEWNIESKFQALNFVDRALATHNLLGLLDAYQEQWTKLNQTLEKSITDNGISHEDATTARQALLKQSFYVGENADDANIAIHDWLRTSLFKNGQINNLRGIVNVNNAYGYSPDIRPLMPTAPHHKPQAIGARRWLPG